MDPVTLMIVLGVIVVLILLVIFWLVSVYNRLVVARNRYKNAYAQIDVQLQRRYDLIPNLVECVKGYMSHEKDTLEAVIQARNMALNAAKKAAEHPGESDAMRELGQAEAQLGGALGRLIALAEAYPDLKANQNMLSLQEELTSTENKIGFARQAYNDAVTSYNNQLQVFPAVVVAGPLGFNEASLLELEPQKREAPKVSFN